MSYFVAYFAFSVLRSRLLSAITYLAALATYLSIAVIVWIRSKLQLYARVLALVNCVTFCFITITRYRYILGTIWGTSHMCIKPVTAYGHRLDFYQDLCALEGQGHVITPAVYMECNYLSLCWHLLLAHKFPCTNSKHNVTGSLQVLTNTNHVVFISIYISYSVTVNSFSTVWRKSVYL